MARPKKEVDRDLVVKLAEKMSSLVDIAYVAGCSVDTIERNYHDAVAEGRACFRHKLREAQIKSALKGNPTMQIWLGKQYLKQRDFKIDLASVPDDVLAAEIQRRLKKDADSGA